MGVNRWRNRARNREAWRRVVEEAKTLGCSTIWKEGRNFNVFVHVIFEVKLFKQK
jgi:hypothetical protein